jgi:SAM-dependent methyltransferase
MKQSDYPSYVARFYDLVYANLRDAVDLDFYLKKIRRADGPVLEVGVGTGRIFRRALAAGADIYGIDTSASMLNCLRRNLAPQHRRRVSLQSAVDFSFNLKFGLIIAPFRVLSHLLKVEDQVAALRNMGQHLAENGLLIFDLFVPNPKLIAEGIREHLDFSGEYAPGKWVRRYIAAQSSLVDQLTFSRMKFVWDGDSGRVSREWQCTMRFYFRYELEHLIERSGLRLRAMLGDFKGRRLNRDSKEFIAVCSR